MEYDLRLAVADEVNDVSIGMALVGTRFDHDDGVFAIPVRF